VIPLKDCILLAKALAASAGMSFVAAAISRSLGISAVTLCVLAGGFFGGFCIMFGTPGGWILLATPFIGSLLGFASGQALNSRIMKR
jgi:uncharacterized membrane protein YjjP (DUF1212 family)